MLAALAAVIILSVSAHAAEYELKPWGVRVSLPDRWEILEKYSGAYPKECTGTKPTKPCFRVTARDSKNVSSMFFIGRRPVPGTTFESWVRNKSIPISIQNICPSCRVEPEDGRSTTLTLGSGQKVSAIEKRVEIHNRNGDYFVAHFVFAYFQYAGLWCNIEFRNKASFSESEGPKIDHIVPDMLKNIALSTP